MIKQIQLALLLTGAIFTATNLKAQDYSLLKVTELHYHPLDSIYPDNDTVSGKNFEFIEFKNISYTESIDVSGVIVDSAINLEFPANTILAPQSYFVAAAKPSKFYDRYKKEAQGNFSSSFSNGGEQVLVFAPDGSIIMDFTYYDEEPWPLEADGDGPSLVAAEINPTGDPSDYSYWTSAKNTHGSPGYSDPISTAIEDVFSAQSGSFNLYPNPTHNDFAVELNNANEEGYSLSIYSLNGKLVYAKSCQGKTIISLEELNIDYGFYLLKVQSSAGIDSRKLVYSSF